ncbi:ROK family protein [Candidatus Woesearchaeota archaeon]|nr:ROK family protein [Candidatus Woesearchaeota archaeon]
MSSIIALDIGGTNISAGLVSRNRLIRKIEIKTEPKKGKKALMEKIFSSISSLVPDKADKICIGSPGPLDHKTGLIGKTPNIPLRGVNLKQTIKRRFKKEVYIDNDANCFALAEAVLGKGKKHRIVIGLTIGTGLGSGIIIDKKIYHGRCFASEIGHSTINFKGPRSRCGNDGCLESYVSRRAILSRAKGIKASVRELDKLAAKRNKKALAVWRETGYYLGIGLANIINILNPDIIIIGGKIAKAWPHFSKTVKETVRKRALFSCRIEQSMLDDAGILGAGLLGEK